MSLKTVKYFFIIIVAATAIFAGWWMWDYYIRSPWTRDGKVCAKQAGITPQVSGSISKLYIKDNQSVNKGGVLFVIDKTSFYIAELNAQMQLAKAQSDLAEANNEANRHHHLSQNYISAEDLDTTNLSVRAMQTSVEAAEVSLCQVW